MGFLGNMLTGGKGIAGANNAHLAEFVIARLTAAEKSASPRKSLKWVFRRAATGRPPLRSKSFFAITNAYLSSTAWPLRLRTWVSNRAFLARLG